MLACHGLEIRALCRSSCSCSCLSCICGEKGTGKAESANMDAKRAAYDGVQEYLDTIQELKSCSREDEYLAGLEQKLDNVVRALSVMKLHRAQQRQPHNLFYALGLLLYCWLEGILLLPVLLLFQCLFYISFLPEEFTTHLQVVLCLWQKYFLHW